MLEGQGYSIRYETPVGKRRVDLAAQNEREVLLVEIVNSHAAAPITVNDLETSQVVVRIRKPSIPRKRGCHVLKWVRCGKNCGGCPHGPYVYEVWKEKGKQFWKYLGKAKDLKDLQDLGS